MLQVSRDGVAKVGSDFGEHAAYQGYAVNQK